MTKLPFRPLLPGIFILAATSVLLSVGFAQKNTEKNTETTSKDQKQIAIGDKAPLFSLKDGSGTAHSLKDYLEKKNDGMVALVFYRSADW